MPLDENPFAGKTITLDPGLTPQQAEARALTRLGTNLANDRKFLAGAIALRRAINLDATSWEAWAELGVCYHGMSRYREAETVLRKAIELNPKYDNAWSNLAFVRGILGHLDEAEQIMRRLSEVPERRVAELLHMGLQRLTNGDWAGGLPLLEHRVGWMGREFKLPKMVDVTYWAGEDLKDKTIFVQTEQGIGDSIAFSRYVHWLKAKWPTCRIVFYVHEMYRNLFWEMRRIVEFVPTGILVPKEPEEQWHYGCYLHTLALHAGATPENIYPDPGFIRARVQEQHKVMSAVVPDPMRAGVTKVGIAWTGNPDNITQDRRSVPLDQLMGLAIDPALMLYSLQCGAGAADLDRFSARGFIEDLSPVIARDLVVTGKAMLELDCVVTCCTSIAHLAGALGVPTLLMLCSEPYWLWGSKPAAASTPLYPSIRVFRQAERADWKSVLIDVAAALKEIRNDAQRNSNVSRPVDPVQPAQGSRDGAAQHRVGGQHDNGGAQHRRRAVPARRRSKNGRDLDRDHDQPAR